MNTHAARRPNRSLRHLEALEERIAPATLIGLDTSNHLLTFDSATPGTVVTTAVTGLGAGESLIGIDFRPATGALYGLTADVSNAGRIYLINPNTGVATFSASLAADPTDLTSPYTALSGTNFGTDFNPVPDRLRVVSDTNQNLRINVDTGLVLTDSDINPVGSALAGAAYINSFAGSTGTTLFDIDITGDRLVTQNPPNNGTLVNQGSLGVDATGVGGFDILSSRSASGAVTNTAFAALTVGGSTGLYGIDLTTGAASSVGSIGVGTTQLRGLTAQIGTPTAKAFTIDASTSHLLSFNAATPNVTTDLGAVTGLGVGETIVGFDFRPADGQLYLVTKNLVNVGMVYTLNTGTAGATLLGVLSADPADLTNPYTSLSGMNFGVDFNPFADRLRIVSDSKQNLRINVATLGVTTDTDLNGAASAATAAAYTNNFSGAATTALFDIDAATDQLYAQNPPNNGTLVAVGALGLDATAINGFDIRTNGEAFATLTVGGVASLYSINLTTGAATLVGAVGAGTSDTLGLALSPSGSLQFSAATLSVGENGSNATLTINRVGGSEGTVSVLVKSTNGTATAGIDYTAFSQVITFGAGVISQNISIPIADDILIEGNETFTVTLSEPVGGAALSTSQTATVTITDNEPVVAAASFIGLDGTNNLLAFSTANPGTIASTTAVTGLGAGETLIGIDFRTATGGLYGITIDAVNAGRVYLINPTTGVAKFSVLLAADPTDSVDGNPAYTSLSGTNFGTDFNPVPDRLRVVSDTNQNLRINVDTGFVFTDGDINPAGSSLAGAAYINSFAGATGTTLFDFDITGDRLVTQSPPNNGTLVNVGALGVDATGVGGFDVVSTRTANGTVTNTSYAALTVGGVTGLYTVDLTNGTASTFGAIGAGTTALRGLTSATGTPSAKAYTIDATANHLLTFNAATPNVTTDLGAVTGLGVGEAIIGFDFRPADGQLYLVTKDLTNGGHLYTVNTTTAVATSLGALAADAADATSPYTSLSGMNFGVDFNPVANRLRIVSDDGQSLRVNVDTRAVTTDTDLNGGATAASAAAYNSNFAGSAATTLFDIDAGTDQLFTQNPPNDGTLVAVGALGVNASAVNGFDIRANGEAFASLTVGGVTGLYSINLATGAATAIGAIGAGTSDTLGLALVANGTFQFASTAVSVSEDNGTATLTINRVGGSDGTVTVNVTTADGTTTAGSDYTGVSRVVTFGPGVTQQTINITLFDDSLVEANETFTVTLSDSTGGAVITPANVATVTILDDEPISVTDKTLTFTDRDGDLVTVKITKGTLDASNFNLVPAGIGRQLVELDLSAAEFLNSNVSITAKRSTLGGDSFVNLGFLDAAANTLGTVTIDGDLGRVNAATIKSLTAQSIGKFGTSTQAAGGTLTIALTDDLQKLTVKTDIVGAAIVVADDIGTVKIGGNLIGNATPYSGTIEAGDRIASVSVTGSVRGTPGSHSGSIIAATSGAIKIRGDFDGGEILLAGINGPADTKQALALASLSVGGNVDRASILVGFDRTGTLMNNNAATGAIKITGDWSASDLSASVGAGTDGLFGTGDDTLNSGDSSIVAKIASISIKGQVLGTLDSVSTTDGFGFAAELIGSFAVGKAKFPLNAKAADSFAVGATGDVNLRDFLMVI